MKTESFRKYLLLIFVILTFCATALSFLSAGMGIWSTIPVTLAIATVFIVIERLFRPLNWVNILVAACALCFFFTLFSGLAVENLGVAVADNIAIPGGWKWEGGLPLRWYHTYGCSPFGPDKIFYSNLFVDIVFWFCISLGGFLISAWVRSKLKRG